MTEQNQQTLEDGVQPQGEQKTEVVEYSVTAAELAKLEFRMKDVVLDVRKKEDMATAKEWRRELVRLRVDLDKLRLKKNEDDQARIKRRNDEAKRITLRITNLEDPLVHDIDAETQRVAEEKAARQREENERAEGLRQRIADITSMAVRAVGKDSANIRDKIEKVKAIDVDGFDEMKPAAMSAKAQTLMTLDDLLTATVEQERMAAEHAQMMATMQAQQAENERLQREASERREREEAEARDRQVQADREAAAGRERESARAKLRAAISECVVDAAGGSSADIRVCIDQLAGLVLPTDDELFASRMSAKSKLDAMLESAQTAERLAMEQREREAAERRRAEAEAAARGLAERGIANIRNQPAVARSGNMLRGGGTIECIRATLAETEAWPIDDRFGPLQLTAQQAKDAAIEEMTGMLERAEEAEGLRLEREREEREQREEDLRAEAARAEKLRVAEARVAAMPDVVQLLKDILADGSLFKAKKAETKALAQRVADLLKTIDPLPGGQFFAADGTLMTGAGERSVFDDVDQ